MPADGNCLYHSLLYLLSKTENGLEKINKDKSFDGTLLSQIVNYFKNVFINYF